ncbi:MAG TPA: PD-(D/E)XK nuclease family protein [Solirubrobacteraceae bacterium]
MKRMAITLITGPANAGKAQVLLDRFCVHAARGEEPILVAPTQADVDHYSRELAHRGVLIGARVRRFDGLIEEIARRGGLTTRRISEQTRQHILAALAQRQAPDGMQTERPTRGLLHALGRFVAELESEHITPARLHTALRAWAAAAQDPGGEGEHLVLLDRVYERYLGMLGGLDWADPQRYAALALDTLRRAPARWRGTPVLFYGFDDLTVAQLDALETLGVLVDAPVTVSLTYEPARVAFAGRASAFQTLLPLAREHTQLKARADHYEPSSRKALHHLERSLFERSAACVAPGRAVRLLQGGGRRAELELIAEEIGSLLEGGLQPGEIAVVHRAPASIAALLSEVFRSYAIPYTLQRALPFAHTAVGAGLLGLLRCAVGRGSSGDLLAWLRTPGLIEQADLVDRLELKLRRGGVLSGDRARSLWEAENWALERIDQLGEAADRGPLALITGIERELEWLLCAPRRRAAVLLAEDELDEARAVSRALQTLTELRELTLAAGDLALTVEDLIELLERLEFLSGEPPTPDRVAVCGPLALRARRVRALILCGLQEGVFPAPAPAQALLSAEHRRALTQSSGLRLSAATDTLAAERYLLYACVSRPEQLLVLSWHTATDDGTPAAPSLFIDDVCDLFEDSLREHPVKRALGAARVCEPPAALRAEPPVLGRLEDPRLLERLREQTVFSASALETWCSCPVRWFVERLLRARDIDPDPEPLARGGLAHIVLRDVLEGLRVQTGVARPTPRTLGLACELLHAALREHEPHFPLSVAPERLPGARLRLGADLERYLSHLADSESPLEPGHLELAFGFPEESELPQLDLGEGIRLRGRIDRIDVSEDGQAVLYDYKGANAPSASRWIREGNFQLALYMHAAEELLGLTVLGGFYQPLSGRDLKARGALSSHAPDGLDHVRGDRLDHAEFRALMNESLTGAREAARQVRSGALEPRPQTCDFRGGCRYPTICRCER